MNSSFSLKIDMFIFVQRILIVQIIKTTDKPEAGVALPEDVADHLLGRGPLVRVAAEVPDRVAGVDLGDELAGLAGATEDAEPRLGVADELAAVGVHADDACRDQEREDAGDEADGAELVGEVD